MANGSGFLKQTRCSHRECGEWNPGRAQFCARCGRPLVVSRPFPPPIDAGFQTRSVGTAYGLWALCLLGAAGIHRFYLGRWVTGILWFFTLGLLGLGSLMDLILIPGMVERTNRELAYVGRW